MTATQVAISSERLVGKAHYLDAQEEQLKAEVGDMEQRAQEVANEVYYFCAEESTHEHC